jgi:hypothetical protein
MTTAHFPAYNLPLTHQLLLSSLTRVLRSCEPLSCWPSAVPSISCTCLLVHAPSPTSTVRYLTNHIFLRCMANGFTEARLRLLLDRGGEALLHRVGR